MLITIHSSGNQSHPIRPNPFARWALIASKNSTPWPNYCPLGPTFWHSHDENLDMSFGRDKPHMNLISLPTSSWTVPLKNFSNLRKWLSYSFSFLAQFGMIFASPEHYIPHPVQQMPSVVPSKHTQNFTTFQHLHHYSRGPNLHHCSSGLLQQSSDWSFHFHICSLLHNKRPAKMCSRQSEP